MSILATLQGKSARLQIAHKPWRLLDFRVAGLAENRPPQGACLRSTRRSGLLTVRGAVTLLQLSRCFCSSVVERVLGKDEVMGSSPIRSFQVGPGRSSGFVKLVQDLEFSLKRCAL